MCTHYVCAYMYELMYLYVYNIYHVYVYVCIIMCVRVNACVYIIFRDIGLDYIFLFIMVVVDVACSVFALGDTKLIPKIQRSRNHFGVAFVATKYQSHLQLQFIYMFIKIKNCFKYIPYCVELAKSTTPCTCHILPSRLNDKQFQ